MADNVTQQIAVLADTYRLLIAEGDMVRAVLKAKIIAAQAVVEDGAEIIAIGNDGSTTQAEVRYPKEVVLAAALQVWNETDPANTLAAAADQSAVHADLSRTRIES
jgi:hypothetical protein